MFLVSQADYLSVITPYVCEFLDGVGNWSGFTEVILTSFEACPHGLYDTRIFRAVFLGILVCLWKLNFLLFCTRDSIWLIVPYKSREESPSTSVSLEKDKTPECLQLTFQKSLEIF